MFVAFCILRAMLMRHIILSPVSCPALHYFSILTHKWQIVKKVNNNNDNNNDSNNNNNNNNIY